MKFTTKVTVAASLVLLIVIGIFTLNNYTVMRDQTQQQLSSVLSQVSQSVSKNIANWLNAKLDIVSATASSYKSTDSQKQLLDKLSMADKAGDFKNVYIGRSTGSFLLDDPSIVLPADYDARSRPWYQLAKSKMDTAFTSPYIDVTTNELTISAVAPIIRNGTLAGVAGGDIDMGVISNIVNSIDFLGYGYGFLVDDKSKILSHPETNLIGKPIQQLISDEVSLLEEFQSVEINETEYLISFVKISGIKNVDWFLGVLINKELAYEPVVSFRNMALIYMVIGILAITVMMQVLLNILLKPLRELRNAIANISQGEGDLTVRLEVKTADEFGELSRYFNLFIEKINISMAQVKKSTESLETSIKSLAEKTESAQELFSEQSGLTVAVATAINELSSSAQDISTNATDASKLASTAKETVTNSQNSLAQNMDSMENLISKMAQAESEILSLEQHTSNIGQVLEVIKGVSEQTNLLALNAAIEAARAGEAGRGFAVVADEVRQLAQRTQESTLEIESTIERLQVGAGQAVIRMKDSLKESEAGKFLAKGAQTEMTHVTDLISSIDNVNQLVANSTAEQTNVTSTIDRDIHQISDDTEKGKSNLESVIAECSDLRHQFDLLEKMIGKFKV